MVHAVAAQELLQALRELPGPGGPPLRVGGVHGLAVAWTAVALRKLHPAQPVVLVTPDEDAAEDLTRDLRFLLGTDGTQERVLRFPADERGPYGEQSPEPAAIMERTAALFAYATGRPPAFLVASAGAVMRRTVPLAALQRYAQLLVVGQRLDRDAFLRTLQQTGYTSTNTVEDVGSYAVRGGIVDVFAAGSPLPVRVDLFGDEVESIRHFDPATQRTMPGAGLRDWMLGPAREVVLDDETVPTAKRVLRDLADHQNIPTRAVSQMMADLDARIPFFGVEGLLPAFYPQGRLGLLDFVRAQSAGAPPVLLVEDLVACQHVVRDAFAALLQQFDRARARGRMAFEPREHATDPDETMAAMDALPHVELERLELLDRNARTLDARTRSTRELRQSIVSRLHGPGGHVADQAPAQSPDALLEPLVEKLRDLRAAGTSTFIVADSMGGVERLKELLGGKGLGLQPVKSMPDLWDPAAVRRFHNVSVHAWLLHGRPHGPSRGAEMPELGAAFISEKEIFGKRTHRSGQKRQAFKTSLQDLESGDHVVHVDHGVGIYRGLTRMALRGVEADYLLLEYAGADKLYLPVTRINLIQRFAGGEGAHPRLDRLGSTAWENTKQRVKKAILAMAGELLTLYAKRELTTGHAFSEPDSMYREFEAAFTFEETPDQQKAIDDTLKDLQRGKPMDRLVCGDVGYGKTEVALRAAMLVALGGRQVAVLAPTTVLAQQHYLTFTERMKDFPVRVDVVSSFRGTKEQKDALRKLKAGELDVIVGTHRLLNPDVGFKDLGLIVVDEEHRFGVAHKERLKQLKNNTHVLTLSATPIPRTLQMSFFGVRDLSLIQTPPQDRRAVRTMMAKFSPEEIKDAITRELKRGGQVYFVHNRVQSIHAMRDFLTRLVPEARIGVGHGQMHAHELEEVMMQFIRKDLNILLCTTIIESGIDIPSANTIIINRADRFGLAQLHQLRGRVGRSSERGYALLLIPPASSITPDAKKRLEVLQKFAELGAGFQVAQHDLELRGAGELLGKNQHGHVASVGFEMYAELLAQAVNELKGKAGLLSEHDAPDPEVNLPIRALIPDGYIPDVHERLALYQRLATARDSAAVYDEVGACNDLYGEAPPEVLALAEIMVLKQKLRQMRARGMDVSYGQTPDGKGSTKPPPPPPRGRPPEGPAGAATRSLQEGVRIIITLGDGALLDADRVLAWVAKDAGRRKLTPQMKLMFQPTPEELMAAGEDITALCRRLLTTVLDECLPQKGAALKLRPATTPARS
jgi:transcription-repair coupling factor (superfamily II helicase)